jgi:hypothetical protein
VPVASIAPLPSTWTWSSLSDIPLKTLRPSSKFFSIAVKKVLDTYDKGSSADKQSIVTILTAVEDGMGWANIELKKRKDTPPLYCVPDGFGLTGEQILEMLRKEIKENPSFAEESYGFVMLLTFKKAFPCNK